MAAKSQPAEVPTFFLPYQRKWLMDRSRLKLLEKSRQIGMSWTTAYSCVRHTAGQGARLDTWVSSRDEMQARLFIDDARKFAEILNLAAKDLGERIIDERSNSAFALQFANGRRLHSLSSNPDAQAGKRGPRVLDEFALHPDPRRLFAVAYPGITWGGNLEIISTHRGSLNYFNELVREIREKGNPKKISLHRVTLQDALDQGFLAKLKSKLPAGHEIHDMDEAAYFDYIRRGCPDEETFLQEYMCVPADDNAAFLDYPMITACEYGEGIIWQWSPEDMRRSRNPLFLGVDVGRVHDLTVMWLYELVAGTLFTRALVILRNRKFSEQEEILWDLLALPSLRRCCIDSSGLGRQLAERAQERFGCYRVEAVTFTAPAKEALAYGFRTVFEKMQVRIPPDRDLRADLRSIKKQVTVAGNIRFAADRGPGGHADRFWAGALGAHAAAGNTGPFMFSPARQDGEQFEDENETRRTGRRAMF